MPNLIKFLEDTGTLDPVLSTLTKLADRMPAATQESLLSELAKYRVVANSRANRRAGACQYTKKIIQLHIRLYDKGREEQRNSTLLHEVAHAITFAVYGPYVQGHGREWKTVMMLLGRPANRTCSYDFLNEERQKAAALIYACQKCEQEFPAQRKKKYPAGAYRHTGCGGVLYLKENKRTGMKMPNPSKQAA